MRENNDYSMVPFVEKRNMWDPFKNVDFSFFDKVFSNFSSDFENVFSRNTYENKSGEIVHEVEVPGFNKDNLQVEFVEGILTISGDNGKRKVFKRLEIGEREVKSAVVEDGILKLVFKSVKPESKKIKVE